MVAGVIVVVGGATAIGSPAAVPGIPSIHVNYSANCRFTMTVDPGISITSPVPPGPTLPPGTYELVVRMPNPAEGYAPCVKPIFTFTGPGVNSLTEFPGEEFVYEHLTPELKPGSTYFAQDENAPSETRRVFTTAASGSNSVLLATGAAGGKSDTGKTSAQTDLVGSAILRYRGKLIATVSAAGKATLKLGARNVGSLKAGKYDVRVDDAATQAGFFVQRRSRKAVVVTSLAFVGTRTKRLALTAGTWTFFSKLGMKTQFTVVG